MGNDIPEIITASISWLNEHQLIKLLAYVLMPDHIYMLFRLGTIKTLDQVMQQFGSYTGHRIADKLGYPVWSNSYYEHAIVDEAKIKDAYMAENPVIAGYVQKSCEWPWLYPSEWKITR